MNERLIAVFSLNCKIFVCSTANVFSHIAELLSQNIASADAPIKHLNLDEISVIADYHSAHAINFDASERHTKAFIKTNLDYTIDAVLKFLYV